MIIEDKKEIQLYALNLLEKNIKEVEKNIKSDGSENEKEYQEKIKFFLSKLDTLKDFPNKLNDGEIVKYHKYLVVREADKYYLSTIRETQKIENEQELLKNHFKVLNENGFIEKKNITMTVLENKIKEEFENLKIKYVKKTPFEEKLETLINYNSPLGLQIMDDYNINNLKQIRMKPKKMTYDDALEISLIKDYQKEIDNIKNSDDLILIKISQLKNIIKRIAPLKDELKDEILENLEKNPKNDFFSLINSVKLENKKPENELNLYQEKVSKKILQDEKILEELPVKIIKNESLVIYTPFDNLKGIKELLNVQKDNIKKTENITKHSKFGII